MHCCVLRRQEAVHHFTLTSAPDVPDVPKQERQPVPAGPCARHAHIRRHPPPTAPLRTCHGITEADERAGAVQNAGAHDVAAHGHGRRPYVAHNLDHISDKLQHFSQNSEAGVRGACGEVQGGRVGIKEVECDCCSARTLPDTCKHKMAAHIRGRCVTLWGRTVHCARAVRKGGCFPPPVATGPRVLNSAPPMLFRMDHARFCRGVVFRGVPGINTVMIGAVRKRPLCLPTAPTPHPNRPPTHARTTPLSAQQSALFLQFLQHPLFPQLLEPLPL